VAMERHTTMKITVIKTPKLKRDMVGKRVRTLYSLSTRVGKSEPGKLATVENFSRGLELLIDKCPHCGFQHRISRVPYNEVEFIEETP